MVVLFRLQWLRIDFILKHLVERWKKENKPFTIFRYQRDFQFGEKKKLTEEDIAGMKKSRNMFLGAVGIGWKKKEKRKADLWSAISSWS